MAGKAPVRMYHFLENMREMRNRALISGERTFLAVKAVCAKALKWKCVQHMFVPCDIWRVCIGRMVKDESEGWGSDGVGPRELSEMREKGRHWKKWADVCHDLNSF
jgi:hypothetical protein